MLAGSLGRANAALATCDLLIETLRGQISRLRRMQVGASSKKLTHEIALLELALEELETESAFLNLLNCQRSSRFHQGETRLLEDA